MVKVYVVTVSFDNGATWAEDDMSWNDVTGIYLSIVDAMKAQDRETNLCIESLNKRQQDSSTISYTDSSDFGHSVSTRAILWDDNRCWIRVHSIPVGDLPDGLFMDYNPESYRYF